MKIKDRISQFCTYGSVLCLLYKIGHDWSVNGTGIIESFFADPFGFIFTVSPILVNLIAFVIRSFDPILFVNYIFRSLVILIGSIAEYYVVREYKLYDPLIAENVGRWYKGLVIVILVVMAEGILVKLLEEGSFDDVLDYMVDGLPFHYCLFCIILGFQKTIITYPFLLEINNFCDVCVLAIVTFACSIFFFFLIFFSIALLWMAKLKV